MPIRYRRARLSDVQRAWSVVQSEKDLFSARMWSELPALLEDLGQREKITLCVFEDLDKSQFFSMGGFGFLQPEFLRAALRNPTQGILEQAFAAELDLRPAWLNQREIADGNRLGALEALTFFATPNFDDPNCALEIGMIFDAFTFFVKAFHFRAIWQENSTPQATEALVNSGYTVFREVATESGGTITLLRASSEPTPPLGSFLASVIVSRRARFGFSRAEQKLLECALLDFSDREAMEHLAVSADAIKKRWRSIYIKVSGIEPRLFQPDDSGAVQRRALLHRLRHNLEELRPFKRLRGNLPWQGNFLSSVQV
jgi:hypothetical protein